MEPEEWVDAFFGPGKVPIKVALNRRDDQKRFLARAETEVVTAFGTKTVVTEEYIGENMFEVADVLPLSECVVMISSTDNGMGIGVFRASGWDASKSVLVFHSDVIDPDVLDAKLREQYPQKELIKYSHGALSRAYHDGGRVNEEDVRFLEDMVFASNRSWFKPNGRIRVHRCDIFRSRDGKYFPVDECGGGEIKVRVEDGEGLRSLSWTSAIFPVSVRLIYDANAHLHAVVVSAEWKDTKASTSKDKKVELDLGGGVVLSGKWSAERGEVLVFLPSDLSAEGDRADETKAHPAMTLASEGGKRTLIRVYSDTLNTYTLSEKVILTARIDGATIEIAPKKGITRKNGFSFNLQTLGKKIQGIIVQVDTGSVADIRGKKRPAILPEKEEIK